LSSIDDVSHIHITKTALWFTYLIQKAICSTGFVQTVKYCFPGLSRVCTNPGFTSWTFKSQATDILQCAVWDKPETGLYLTAVVCAAFVLAGQRQITQIIQTNTWIIRRHQNLCKDTATELNMTYTNTHINLWFVVHCWMQTISHYTTKTTATVYYWKTVLPIKQISHGNHEFPVRASWPWCSWLCNGLSYVNEMSHAFLLNSSIFRVYYLTVRVGHCTIQPRLSLW